MNTQTMVGSVVTAVIFLILGMVLLMGGMAPVFATASAFVIALVAGFVGVSMLLAYGTEKWDA